MILCTRKVRRTIMDSQYPACRPTVPTGAARVTREPPEPSLRRASARAAVVARLAGRRRLVRQPAQETLLDPRVLPLLVLLVAVLADLVVLRRPRVEHLELGQDEHDRPVLDVGGIGDARQEPVDAHRQIGDEV